MSVLIYLYFFFKFYWPLTLSGPSSSVGIATGYGLYGPRIESRWARDFPHLSTQPPILWVPGLSRGWNGRDVALTTHPHLAPRLKKEQSYTYTPLWDFVACSRMNFTFTFTFTLPLWTCHRASGSEWHLRRFRLYKCVTLISNVCLVYTLNRTQAFIDYMCMSCGPGSSVGIVTDYGLHGPGIESRWGGRFSAPVHTGPGAHPASCTMGAGSLPGVKCGWGVLLTTHPLLVPKSWKSRAIPLPTLWTSNGVTLPLPLSVAITMELALPVLLVHTRR
jgi:hypothetical protein